MITSSGASATGSPSTSTVAVPVSRRRARQRGRVGRRDRLGHRPARPCRTACPGRGSWPWPWCRPASRRPRRATPATRRSAPRRSARAARASSASKPGGGDQRAATAAGGSSRPTRRGRPGPARPAGGPAPSASDSAGSISASSASGQAARCTDSRRVRGRPATTRSCQTRSVMNGVSGAISRVTVSQRPRAGCASAAGSPRQNRRRQRRTYQLDRSSTNAASSLPARWVSNAVQRRVDRRATSVFSSDEQPAVEQRAVGRRPGRPPTGAQPAVRAYRAWKATVFQ